MKKIIVPMICASLCSFAAAQTQVDVRLTIQSYTSVTIVPGTYDVSLSGGATGGSVSIPFNVEANDEYTVEPTLTGSGGPGTWTIGTTGGLSGLKPGGSGFVEVTVSGITLSDSPQPATVARTLVLNISSS
jgi:hypothetical protein